MSDKMPKTPAPAVIELSSGETVEVRAFTGYHFMYDERVDGAFVQLKQIINELVRTAESTGSDLSLADALFACRQPLKALVEASLDKPREWYKTLEADDLFKLAGAVYAVNAEKYAGKFAELMGPVAKQLQANETPEAQPLPR